MNNHKGKFLSPRLLLALTMLLSAALVLGGGIPAFGNGKDKRQASQLVEKSRMTMESFLCDDSLGAIRDLLPKAKGVLIVPALLKGAFFIGGSGGNGVLLVRNKETDSWSEPAFYTLGGASIGLQIGGQSSEVVLLAMTERGVSSFLASSFKLGGDVGVAAGPVGIGASAATANLSADILSFARSKGLYGGISLEGAVVAVRGSLNHAYYGKRVSPAEILVAHAVTNPQARGLNEFVAKGASGSMNASSCMGNRREKSKT